MILPRPSISGKKGICALSQKKGKDVVWYGGLNMYATVRIRAAPKSYGA